MSTLINTSPIPISDPIANVRRRDRFGEKEKDPLENMLSFAWLEFFTNQGQVLSQAAARIAVISLSAQEASIAATDMSDGALSGGLYRVSYYARITQPATTSSELTIGLDWTDSAVVVAYSGALMNGNLVTTFQSNSQIIDIQNLSPIRYTVTYVSVGATPMQYKLLIVLEQVEA